MNVLFSDFDYAPFNQIKNSDYLTSIRQGINEFRAEIDTISNNKKATFKNTIEALDYSGLKLDRITSIFFNINAAETSKEIQFVSNVLNDNKIIGKGKGSSKKIAEQNASKDALKISEI